MNLKRFGKYIACLLLVAAMLTVAAPASASDITESAVIAAEDPLTRVEGQKVTTVFRSASYGSARIGSFKDGTKVTVLSTQGDFYKVDCFDMVGYVPKHQLQANEAGEYYVNCQDDSSATKYLPTYGIQNALALRDAVVAEAHKHLGVQYVTGGTTPRGFDCSGLTYYLFNTSGFELHRSMLYQMDAGIVIAKEDLQYGDLVFFSNTGSNGGFASHIGVYIGNGQIIHASSGYRGVTIDDLSTPYYTTYYQCARRVILTDLAPSVSIPVADVMPGDRWRTAN